VIKYGFTFCLRLAVNLSADQNFLVQTQRTKQAFAPEICRLDRQHCGDGDEGERHATSGVRLRGSLTNRCYPLG
jgi:hypothetical protein